MSKTVIAVGGHIGDMELTAGPTLAKVVLEGGRAIIIDCTYGERGHPTIPPSAYREQKLDEAQVLRRDDRRRARHARLLRRFPAG